MLALALSLTVLAAPPPRGLTAAHTMELVERIEERLPKWLTLSGDRKDLLATAKELEGYLKAVAPKDDLKPLLEAALQEQSEAPALKDFTASSVLIEFGDRLATVHFFDGAGNRCAVPLLILGTKAAPRYVLMSGPSTDQRTLEQVVDQAKSVEAMQVYAEKKSGVWTTGPRPSPPPPDCKVTMKNALKALFIAEKEYFIAHDAYTKSVTKLGVDLKALRITSAKASVAGTAPTQTFVLEVGLRGGVMQMNDKGETTLVGDCAP